MESCKARVKRQRAEKEETTVSTQGETRAQSRKKYCATKTTQVVHGHSKAESSIPEPVPLASKHPIVSYTFRVRSGSEGYWEFKRSNDTVQGFTDIYRMLDSMDREDVIAVWIHTTREVCNHRTRGYL